MLARVRGVVGTFGWWQWLLAGVFLFALLGATLFAVRTVRYAVYWRSHQNEPIQGWMTVNYVAHSYRVPPHVLWNALGIEEPRPPLRRDRRPLREIAEAQGRSFEDVRATLMRAIDAARPPGVAPPPPPPGLSTPAPSDRGAP